jgi:alpha-1,3-rhamnosyl/mannosyltransferase
VITPSHATAAEAKAHWGVDAVVAHHGPGQAPRSDRGIPRHFLYVGDEEPRKNLARLREAHARSGVELPLVVAGGGGADLAALHRHAAALVLPSLHEGFGLTALEALHAGTPVLASDIPALREVCADAARYVDPYDVDAMARSLTELATVPPLREELRRRGTARAAAFSWRACAEAHVRAYEQAIASSSRS